MARSGPVQATIIEETSAKKIVPIHRHLSRLLYSLSYDANGFFQGIWTFYIHLSHRNLLFVRNLWFLTRQAGLLFFFVGVHDNCAELPGSANGEDVTDTLCRESGLVDGRWWPLSLYTIVVYRKLGRITMDFVVVVWLNYGLFHSFEGQCM